MKAYEELAGAQGRRIYYRAERYRARDIFPRLMPEIVVDRAAHRVDDLSMTGVSVFTERGFEWPHAVGEEVPFHLRVGSILLHSGRGRVARVEPTPFRTKVAFHLTDGYLDIPGLIARQREISLRRQIEASLHEITGRVDPAYRCLCADVLHMLRRYRDLLASLERDILANGGRGTDGDDTDNLFAMCEERVLPDWRDLWHHANGVVRPLLGDPEALAAAKRFTELVVTPDFVEGAIWRRAYEKPLGYPGDFEVMNYMYEWKLRGDTLFARLVHRLGLDIAECIVNRMVMMKQIIAGVVAAKEDGDPALVTSIGCGPAQEVVNYLRLRHLPNPVHFTLIDQDHRALSHAYENAYPEVVRLGNRSSIDCLEVSFTQLMRTGELFRQLPPQDLIYLVGLIDYLSPRRARELTRDLYAQLAPGGTLVIGNMRDSPGGTLWPLEFVCDWSLIYRDGAEMMDFVAGLDPAAVELKTDLTERVWLLYLRRPDPARG